MMSDLNSFCYKNMEMKFINVYIINNINLLNCTSLYLKLDLFFIKNCPTIEYAIFNEDTLQYHIDKYSIKKFVTKETVNSKSIYCKLKDCIMYIM